MMDDPNKKMLDPDIPNITSGHHMVPHLRLICGKSFVLLGLAGIGLGSIWAPPTLAFFASYQFAQKFELIIPFLPIFLILLGAFVLNESRPT